MIEKMREIWEYFYNIRKEPFVLILIKCMFIITTFIVFVITMIILSPLVLIALPFAIIIWRGTRDLE